MRPCTGQCPSCFPGRGAAAQAEVGQLGSEIKGLTGANAQIDSELKELESLHTWSDSGAGSSAGARSLLRNYAPWQCCFGPFALRQ